MIQQRSPHRKKNDLSSLTENLSFLWYSVRKIYIILPEGHTVFLISTDHFLLCRETLSALSGATKNTIEVAPYKCADWLIWRITLSLMFPLGTIFTAWCHWQFKTVGMMDTLTSILQTSFRTNMNDFKSTAQNYRLITINFVVRPYRPVSLSLRTL